MADRSIIVSFQPFNVKASVKVVDSEVGNYLLSRDEFRKFRMSFKKYLKSKELKEFKPNFNNRLGYKYIILKYEM